MRELLDSSTKRRLEILEQLNQTANWISSNELAHANKASLRTINSDVQYLKENWFPHLIIETSKKNGVRLSTPPSSHASLIYHSVILNSEAFQLLEKIFFNSETNIEDWEEEMFISESSLYRISNQLAASLAHYGLSLQKRPCRVTNKNELHVRHFYANFFIEVYGMREWPFALNRRKMVNLAQQLLANFGYDLNEVLTMHLAYLLAVSFERMSQGFFTAVDNADQIGDELKQAFFQHEEGFNDLLKIIDLRLTERTVVDLINSIYFIKPLILDNLNLPSLKARLQQFIGYIQTTMGLEIDEASKGKIESILTIIYLSYTEYPFNDFILFDRYEFNASAIRNNFPTFTHLVENGLQKMEAEMDFPWMTQFKNNVIFWLMVKWKGLPTILEDKKDKAKILVLSNLGSEHADLLAELINKNFGSKVTIDVYRDSIIFLDDSDLIKNSHYDFYVTTFLREDLPANKIIVIDAIPSDQDWGKLRRGINQVNKINSSVLDFLKHTD